MKQIKFKLTKENKMKCINEAVWITSDSSVFVRYSKARYHEIVLLLKENTILRKKK